MKTTTLHDNDFVNRMQPIKTNSPDRCCLTDEHPDECMGFNFSAQNLLEA
jgi:hypothetical protein